MDNNLNIELIEKGVSNENGERIFYDVKGSHQTSASLSDQKLINEYRIQTLRLDSFIEETGLIPDLIKIDVELHEPEVIEGLGKFLINNGPTLIIEVLTETVAEKLNNLFKNTSYIYYELDKMNKLKMVDSIKPKSCYNYLITSESF